MKFGFPHRLVLSVVSLSVAGIFVSYYGSQPHTEIFQLGSFPFTGRGVAVMIAFIAIMGNIILHVAARMYARPLALAVPKLEPPRKPVITLDLRHADPVDGCESIPPHVAADRDPEDDFIEEALRRERSDSYAVLTAQISAALDRGAMPTVSVDLNASRQDDVMVATGPYGSTADRPSMMDGNGEVVRESSLEERLDAVVPDCSLPEESKPDKSGEHSIDRTAALAALISEALARNAMPTIPVGPVPAFGNTPAATEAAA